MALPPPCLGASCLLVLGCVAPSSYLLPVSRRHPVALWTWHFAGLSDTQQHTEASLIETAEPKHSPFERIRYLLISKRENLGTTCDVSSVDWYYEENVFLHFAKPVVRFSFSSSRLFNQRGVISTHADLMELDPSLNSPLSFRKREAS